MDIRADVTRWRLYSMYVHRHRRRDRQLPAKISSDRR